MKVLECIFFQHCKIGYSSTTVSWVVVKCLSNKFCCDNTLVPFEVLSCLSCGLTYNTSIHKNEFFITSLLYLLCSGANTVNSAKRVI